MFGLLPSLLVAPPVLGGTIFEDDARTNSGDLQTGRTPSIDNTEGNTWAASGAAATDVGDYWLSQTQYGYSITSRKNFTLRVVANTPNGQTLKVWVRSSQVTDFATATKWRVDFADNGNVTVYDTTDSSVATGTGASNGGTDQVYEVVMGSDDSLLVKIGGASVTLSSTVTLTGSVYGIWVGAGGGNHYIQSVKAS